MVSYRGQFLVLLGWIFIVTALFKVIPDKQIAGIVTGLGFLLWPTIFLVNEFKKNTVNRVHVALLVLFLVCSALPVFFLRVLNWGVEFDTLSFFGVPSVMIHKVSRYLYLMMMASTLYFWFQERKGNKQ